MTSKNKKPLRVRDTELCRDALKRLGATSNNFETYAAQNTYERTENKIWLAPLFGEQWYIDRDLPRATIAEIAISLQSDEMDEQAVRKALHKLWMVTKHDRDSAQNREAILNVYVEKFATYENEAILTVLNDAASKMKFWPAWSELEEELRALCPERTFLIRALRRVYPLVKERSA